MKTFISFVCIIQNSPHLSFAILCGQQIKSNAEFCVIREKSVLIPVNRARHPPFPTLFKDCLSISRSAIIANQDHGEVSGNNYSATDRNVTSWRSRNTSNVSKQTGENTHQTIENETKTYKFTWSASCLYVNGGDISLTSMNVFSLWAMYPNKREEKLHLTLPQFCRGFSLDSMIYFFSTVGFCLELLF